MLACNCMPVITALSIMASIMAASKKEPVGEIVVSGLNIFPIKSCRACKVDEIKIDSHGVVGDRTFMLVDGSNRCISQSKCPKLSLIEAVWVEDGGNRVLKINAPGMKELIVVPVFEGERIETTVLSHSDTVWTIDQGQEACEWFSSFLQIDSNNIIKPPVKLVAAVPGVINRTVPNLPPSLKGKLPPSPLGLASTSPVSIVSNESLADLNQKYRERITDGDDIPLNRFRMNIELTGCARPFQEDEWLVIRIGTTLFLVYFENERCKITCINQETAEVDKVGPLDILRQYRAPAGPAHAKFGQLMIPLQVGGVIKLGDRVEVLDIKK